MNKLYPSLFFDISRKFFFIFTNLNKSKHKFLNYGFYLLSLGFSLIVKIRNFFYDKKILRTTSINKFIISVGNIVVGGTGKTQIVCWLVEELSQSALALAVLYRGYKGSLSNCFFPIIVDPCLSRPTEVGDEPFLCARRFSKVPVIINKNRLKCAKIAEQIGADVLIIDDGLQYRKLDRDLDLVIVNAHDLFGGGDFLPYGRLRDHPKRLSESDFVFVNGNYSQEVEEKLIKKTSAPIIYFKPKITEISCTNGDTLSTLKNIPIGVFCGLGSPENFLTTLKEMGALVVAQYILPDHQAATLSELRFLSEQVSSRGGRYLICTEKDFVKCPELPKEAKILPIGWTQVRLVITHNASYIDNLLDTIRKRNRRSFL